MSSLEQQRRDSLYLVLLGCCIFLLVGPIAAMLAPIPTFDFKCLYFGSRCLIEGHDPYNEREVQRVLHAEGGEDAADTDETRIVKRRFNNLPSVFLISAPLALLPYSIAVSIWLAGMSAAFVAASLLVWKVAATHAPVLAGALVFLALANSELFFAMANAAVYAIPLCIVATWCFVRNRHVVLGVVCLAISLMLKPHDSGLIWLYFLLVGGKSRRAALGTLLAVVVLSLPVVAYLSAVAPHWPVELLTNLHAYAAKGDVNDPGPTGMTGQSTIMIVSLQAVFSLVSDTASFYNAASYLVCGALLLPWCLKVLRSGHTAEQAWLAIAPVAALTMLPVYHRSYDGRLLLLAIPACAILHAKSRSLGRIGFVLLAAGTLVTGGITWSLFAHAVSRIPAAILQASPHLLIYTAMLPVPLTLLVTGCFFLWAYLRNAGAGKQALD